MRRKAYLPARLSRLPSTTHFHRRGMEPVESILKRFVTGACLSEPSVRKRMRQVAVAMNKLHGRSNTGEGGEDAARFGTEMRSAIKQVASGRFGSLRNIW